MDRGGLVGPVMIRSDDTVRYVDDAFCRFVGVDSPDAVTDRSPEELVVAPDREPFADHFDGFRDGNPKVDGGSIRPSDKDPRGSVFTLQVPMATEPTASEKSTTPSGRHR